MSKISDLMVQIGGVEGQRHLNRGRLLGGAVSTVAALPTQVYAANQEAANQALGRRQVESGLETDRLQQLNLRGALAGRDAETAAARETALLRKRLALSGSLLSDLEALPLEQRASAYPAVRQRLITEADWEPDQVPPDYRGTTWTRSKLAWLGATDKQLEAMFPQQKGVVVGPGSQLRNEATGDEMGPPTPFKPAEVTFGQPFDATLNGRPVKLRSGSDGKTYDMGGRVVDGGAVGVYQAPSTAQLTMELLVDPSGQQRYVTPAQANGLLAQGWRKYDPVASRADESRAQSAVTQGSRANDGLALVDQLLTFDKDGRVLRKNMPGFDDAFGALQSKLPTLRQNTADVEVVVDRIVSLMTQPEMQSLRGLGPASDRDVAIIQAGATTLRDRKLGEEAAARELWRIRQAFERLQQASMAAMGSVPNGTTAVIPGRGGSPAPKVKLVAPDGSVQDVDANLVDWYLSKGARRAN